LSAQSAMATPVDLRPGILKEQDPSMKLIGKLLIELGLEPIAHRKTIGAIGEVDLVFKLQRDAFVFVFIVEVSKLSSKQNQKIDHFFSRWSDPANLDRLLGELRLPGAKNMRIYVDLSRVSKDIEDTDLSSVRHHLDKADIFNRLLFRDDIAYFEKTRRIIGKWSRSDLLSFLRVPRTQTSLKAQAIQFYLGDYPAFSFVSDVMTLLDSCYIWRRLGDQKGYQRALDDARVRSLGRDIQSKKIVAFPNSILVNCEENLADMPAPSHECPKIVNIQLPTSYCSSIVVDGQHRLLGFSQIDDSELPLRHLPVIAFQKLPRKEEVRLFIDINSKQKRVDSNLTLDLKADFHWDPDQNYTEHTERIIVLIARQLSAKGPLQEKIYFGTAREDKGDKITLSTLVSIMKENQLVGGKWHYWQSKPKSEDIDEPLHQVKNLFDSLLEVFGGSASQKGFVMSNVGLRIVFRAVQILERNRRAAQCDIDEADFIKDLKRILDDDLISELRKLYGEGGSVEGTKRIVQELKRELKKRYASLELDFRRLRLETLAVSADKELRSP